VAYAFNVAMWSLYWRWPGQTQIVALVSLLMGGFFAFWLVFNFLTAHNWSAVAAAILTTLWLWLYFQRRPPRKRHRQRLRSRVAILGHRLGVVPA
jgi:hypothetical protein